MTEEINVVNFIRSIETVVRKTPEQEIRQHESNCKIFDIIFHRGEVTPEELDAITLEQLEWVMDAVQSVPFDFEEHKHYEGESLYEYFRAKDLVGQFSSIRAARTGSKPIFF